jgi:hypothetical protein
MIDEIIFEIKKMCDKWHTYGTELFKFEDDIDCRWLDPDKPWVKQVIKLLYHNYQIWHFIELYTAPDSNTVLFVYDGGIKHNKLRNDTIELLDVELCKEQKGTGKINSETIGSIIDRITILYIKKLHLQDSRDARLAVVEEQLDVLIQCAKELMYEMKSGERQCKLFGRFKIEYSGQ